MNIDGEWYVYLGDEDAEMMLTISGETADLDGKKGVVAMNGDQLAVTFQPYEVFDQSVSHAWIIATEGSEGFVGTYRYDLRAPDGTELLDSSGPVDEFLTMKRAVDDED